MRELRRLLDRLRGPRPVGVDDPAKAAMAYFRQGVAHAEAGRFRRAVDAFTAARDLAPATAGIYHHRGSAFAELGRYREAIADYDTAIRLNPGYPDTYLDRGNSYHAQKEHANAITPRNG